MMVVNERLEKETAQLNKEITQLENVYNDIDITYRQKKWISSGKDSFYIYDVLRTITDCMIENRKNCNSKGNCKKDSSVYFDKFCIYNISLNHVEPSNPDGDGSFSWVISKNGVSSSKFDLNDWEGAYRIMKSLNGTN